MNEHDLLRSDSSYSSLHRRGAITQRTPSQSSLSSHNTSSPPSMIHRVSTSTVSSTNTLRSISSLTSSKSSYSQLSDTSTNSQISSAHSSYSSYIDLLYPTDPELEKYHTARVRANREKMSAEFFARRKAERKGHSRTSSDESGSGSGSGSEGEGEGEGMMLLDIGERERRQREAGERERVFGVEGEDTSGFKDWERRWRSEMVRMGFRR